jgi:hypothetical protein
MYTYIQRIIDYYWSQETYLGNMSVNAQTQIFVRSHASNLLMFLTHFPPMCCENIRVVSPLHLALP